MSARPAAMKGESQDPGLRVEDAAHRTRRRRSVALLIVLLSLVALFYAVAVARIAERSAGNAATAAGTR